MTEQLTLSLSQLLYSVVLLPTVQQSESALHTHASCLFGVSFLLRSPQSTKQSSLCFIVTFHQLSILYIIVYICPSSLSVHPTSPLTLLVSIHLFSTSTSLVLLCKQVHLCHFSRFHIYALIYDICFSLSDILHSVRQSLDSSTSLQITKFVPFNG